MWIEASAPSNIALIKYMGKLDLKENKPCNTSLSFTLSHLRTYIRIKKNDTLSSDQWSALVRDDLRPIELSEKGRTKFLAHLGALKVHFGLDGFFEVQSANNFPSDCGLASSASSYAALTKVVHDFTVSLKKINPWAPDRLALLAKLGSGSSCRSFFAPWAAWSETGVGPVEIPGVKDLMHQVILCDQKIKSVSSSDAHKRVLTSDLFNGRPERAQIRFDELVKSLNDLNWKRAFEICWNEFWDMHLLFHTARPAFMYMNSDSQNALSQILLYWEKHQDGPLVTMDAGSNIHLLYRPDQSACYFAMIKFFQPQYSLWTDKGYLERS